MTVTIKNLKNHLINLGISNGTMLALGGNQVKTISDEVARNFDRAIETYVNGGFIEIVEVTKNPVVKDVSTESVVKEEVKPKKKSKKSLKED
jgi:hypothetical protein